MRVGVASTVVEDVRGSLANQEPKRMVVGEDVFFDERVITTTAARAVVQFRDRSTLDIGPDATVVIDRSVFNPEESNTEKVMTVVKGAFRFVSGVTTKTADTEIRTPSGTLGIRGSIVVGEVSLQGDVVLFPVEGQPSWTNSSGTQNVPEGGALIATFVNGQAFVTGQMPGSFAGILGKIVGQIGDKPPTLQPFSPNQMSDNGNDHLVPGDQQTLLQPFNPNGKVPPANPNGTSDIVILLTGIQNGQVPGSGGSKTDLDFIANFVKNQITQRNSNEINGVVGVTEELYNVMPHDKALKVATDLTSQSPDDATEIAALLEQIIPGSAQEILQAAILPPPPTPPGGNHFGTFGASTGTGAGSSISK